MAGSNTSAIAQMLNDEDIPTPGQVFQSAEYEKFNHRHQFRILAMILRVLKIRSTPALWSVTRRKSCGVGSRSCPAGASLSREHEAIISKKPFCLLSVSFEGIPRTRKVSDYPLPWSCLLRQLQAHDDKTQAEGWQRFTLAITLTTTGIQSAVLEKSTAKAVWKILFTMRLAISWPLALNVQNREVGDIRKTAIKDCAAKLESIADTDGSAQNGKAEAL